MKLKIGEVKSTASIREEVLHSDIIVDALFGTGLEREVGGLYREVIELINESEKKVVSIDIPSGINGDSGEIMGSAVKADYTITFGLPKIGNILYPGYGYGGKLYVSHISYPPVLSEDREIKIEINSPLRLPSRDPDTHKGSYGKALFIAGSSRYFGAPYFSALSFLKAGGGLSYLAAPRSISPFIANKGSEIVFLPQEETEQGSMALKNRDALIGFSQGVDMVVIGPGLSLAEETQRLVRELVPRIEKPLLIDGDGITATIPTLESIRKRKEDTILTPHPGEFSRLTKMEIREINKKKVELVQDWAKRLKSTLVLKGAHTLIGYPDGSLHINTSGNPGMATAGSGDVLTGTIAALYGLGLTLSEAVRMGVFIHGLSGDLAAGEKGEDGITAQDILDYLPLTLKHYRENFSQISENIYETIYVI